MTECGVCYETHPPRFLPCNHSVCLSCYDSLQGDTCPFCRAPFRQTPPPQPRTVLVDPDYWLDYDRNQWTVMSRFTRSGNETIRVFRNGEIPESWRNDSMSAVVKRRRRRLNRRLRR